MAAAQLMPGTTACASVATAATVSPTTITASAPIGSQFSRMSRGEASNAASRSVGATNRVSVSCGSRSSAGVPGSSAAAAPASESRAG